MATSDPTRDHLWAINVVVFLLQGWCRSDRHSTGGTGTRFEQFQGMVGYPS